MMLSMLGEWGRQAELQSDANCADTRIAEGSRSIRV